MATRRYKFSPGDALVTEEVGDAVNSDIVELTVELASTAVNENGSTRGVLKSEVLLAIDEIKEKILNGNWPPA